MSFGTYWTFPCIMSVEIIYYMNLITPVECINDESVKQFWKIKPCRYLSLE